MKHPWTPDEFPPLTNFRPGEVGYLRVKVLHAHAPNNWLVGMKPPQPVEARVVPVDRQVLPLMDGWMLVEEAWLLKGADLMRAAQASLRSSPPRTS